MFQIGSEDRFIGEIRRWRSKTPKTQTLGCHCSGSPQDGFEGHKLLHKVTGFGGFGIYVFHQFSSAGHPAIRQHHRKIKADVFSISHFLKVLVGFQVFKVPMSSSFASKS